MQRLISLILIGALALTTAALLSCSDDNGTNNDKDRVEAQYVPMKTMTDEMVIPMATEFIGSGMGRLNGVSAGDLGLGKAASPSGDSIMIVYHPLSGWWEGYFSTQSDPEADPYTELVVRDSIQFKSLSGHNQFEPNDSTDYVHDIPSLLLTIDSDSLNSSTQIAARNDVIYSDLQSEIATVDGPMNLSLAMQVDTLGKTISGTFLITLQIDEVQIPIPESDNEQVCPLSGVITYTLVENVTSQFVSDEATNTTWSIRITIVDPQTYLVKISAGNIEFDEYQLEPEYICSSEFASSPVGQALHQLARR